MLPKQIQHYENCNKMIFPGVGKYDIPIITGEDCDVTDWIGFNFARRNKDPENHGVHFFLDDYQFNCVWRQPDMYLNMLRKYQAVLTPDFSTFTDFPAVVQIYNHYRKHWLGAYWQLNGIHVIPTVSWSDAASWQWCFDGEPEGATVAVSSVGTQKNKDARRLFIDGYNEMLTRLQPKKIIFYGNVPDECRGNIVNIKPFVQKWREDK